MQRYTVNDFNRDYPTDDACLQWLVAFFYPDGIHCSKCNRVTPHHKIKSRKSYSCNYCGHHVHPTADTIFEKSSTSLRLWFYAIYLMSATRAGISAKQLERELGVTYKTAWRMFKQIRSMMMDDPEEKLTGTVEIDETYFQPDPTKKRALLKRQGGRGVAYSQTIMGMVERGGKAKVRHIPNTGVHTLKKQIDATVDQSATIYTDQLPGYRSLSKRGFDHASVNHQQEFARGQVHIQNIENLWSHAKRGIKGVYRKVGHQYLESYVNEYAFRYSHRNDEQPMFISILSQVRKA